MWFDYFQHGKSLFSNSDFCTPLTLQGLTELIVRK
jgi:hypothetical protein